ncbi:hypothetical protein [Lacrimispora xylanisolvens]|uniref:hypothetical protein n=1 Tax=Lacrimispora xylanisolvens TaxID=384636 RepID=UPI002402B112
MSYEAVDYLIKLELNAQSLLESVQKALSRLESLRVSIEYKESGRPLLQSYYEKFFMRLLHNLFDSEEQFDLQSKDLKLSFTEHCYFAAFCEIQENNHANMEYSKLMNLYSSTLQMYREIITRYLPAYVVSLDMKHFAVVFHLDALDDFKEDMIKNAFLNASEMVNNYFNVTVLTGVGSPLLPAIKNQRILPGSTSGLWTYEPVPVHCLF